MRLENIDKIAVSEETKGWVADLVNTDMLYGSIRQKIEQRMGSESESWKQMAGQFDETFSNLRAAIVAQLGTAIAENVSDTDSCLI